MTLWPLDKGHPDGPIEDYKAFARRIIAEDSNHKNEKEANGRPKLKKRKMLRSLILLLKITVEITLTSS